MFHIGTINEFAVSIYHKTSIDVNKEIQDIEKARENPRAFSVLYERYHRNIFLYVYRKIMDKETTEDLVSQVFIKAMSNLHAYEHRGLPFSSWLFRIAFNEMNLFFRSSKKVRCISLESASVHKLQEDVEVNFVFDNYVLVKLFKHLRDEEVEMLEMRYLEGYSIKEVADILDISESNVKVKVFRTMEKIRKIIQKEGIGNHE